MVSAIVPKPDLNDIPAISINKCLLEMSPTLTKLYNVSLLLVFHLLEDPSVILVFKNTGEHSVNGYD